MRHTKNDGFIIDSQMGFKLSDQESKRFTTSGGLNRNANGSTYGYEAAAEINLLAPISGLNNWIFTPEMGTKASWYRQDGYKENNAGSLSLIVDDITTTSLRPGIGLTASTTLSDENESLKISPFFYSRLDYELGSTKNSIKSAFSATPTTIFTSQGNESGRTWLNLGTGLTLAKNKDIKLDLGYDSSINRKASNHTVSATLKLSW